MICSNAVVDLYMDLWRDYVVFILLMHIFLLSFKMYIRLLKAFRKIYYLEILGTVIH